MPSGKKARGRKNRAKKETNHQRTLWEPTILQSNDVASNNANSSSCEHLLVAFPQIPQVSPAVSFMNRLAGKGFFVEKSTRFTGVDPVDVCIQSVILVPELVAKDSERSQAINLLLRFVRNVLLRDSVVEGEKWFHILTQNEVMICCMINVLEIFGTYPDPNVVNRRARKTCNRLAGGNRRDAVKFVAKRLPCACLKRLHSAAREKVAKMGKCIACLKQFPRSQLHVCTGCMISEYCSRECQRAAWSCHKEGCGCPELVSRDLPADYVVERNPHGR